jgi:hypothetical protein
MSMRDMNGRCILGGRLNNQNCLMRKSLTNNSIWEEQEPSMCVKYFRFGKKSNISKMSDVGMYTLFNKHT